MRGHGSPKRFTCNDRCKDWWADCPLTNCAPDVRPPASRNFAGIRIAIRVVAFFFICFSANLAAAQLEMATTNTNSTPTVSRSFRVTWGGGEARSWHAIVRCNEGVIKLERSLGLDPRTPGSVFTHENGIRVENRSVSVFGGFDFEIEAPLSAEITFDFFSEESPDIRYQQTVKLDDLLRHPLVGQLDDFGNRISVVRAPGDQLHVNTDRDSMVFWSGESFRFSVEPRMRLEELQNDPKLSVQLVEVKSDKLAWSQEIAASQKSSDSMPVFGEIEIPIPSDEGVYQIRLALVDRSFPNWNAETISRLIEMVVVSRSSKQSKSNVLWSEVARLDASNQFIGSNDWRQRITQLSNFSNKSSTFSNAQHQATEFDDRQLLQISPGGWNAIRLPIRSIDEPHIIEIEYLHDGPMRLGISLLQPNENNQIPHFGADTGIVIPRTTTLPKALTQPSIQKHRFVVWPRHKNPLLLFANRDSENSASIGRIRILAGPEELASARRPEFNNGSSGQKAPTRKYLAYQEKPLFQNQFDSPKGIDPETGQLLDNWQTFWQSTNRLVQHLKANGYTGIAITVLSDGCALYPSRQLQSTPKYDNGVFWSDGRDPVQKDILELLFRICDRENLEVVPVIEFSTPIPELEKIRQVSPQLVDGIDLVDFRGQPADRQIVDRFAAYNPMDQRVQQATANIIRELTARYKHHPSFSSVGVKLSPETLVPLAGPEWGLDASTIQRFAAENGIEFSADSSANVIAMRRQVLTQHGTDWLNWRAQQITKWFDQLQSAIGDERVGGQLILMPADFYQTDEARTAFSPSPRKAIDIQKTLLRMGIDFRSVAANPSTIVLQPHRLAADDDLVENRANIQIENDPKTVDFYSTFAGGSLFVHRHRWTHFAQLQESNPFGNQINDLFRIQPLSAAGFWNRQRFAKTLHHNDSQIIIDGGWLLPTGQHSSIAQSVNLFTSLPSKPFEVITPTNESKSNDLVSIRQYRQSDSTYFYATNLNPWPVQCEILVSHVTSNIASLTDSDIDVTVIKGNPVITLDLDPFETAGARIDGPEFVLRDYSVKIEESIVDAMKGQLDKLLTKVSKAGQSEPWNILLNGDFESSSETGVAPGWTIEERNKNSVRLIPEKNSHQGEHCLEMKSDGNAVFIRSQPIPLPQTGRISVIAWVRSTSDQIPPLRISIDAEHRGRSYYRFGNLNGLESAAESSEWQRFAVHFEDLPTTDLENLTIGFDLMGAGSVQIDHVQIFDRWFDEQDTSALTQMFALAAYRLNNSGDLNGCREILEQYWARFVDQYFPDQTESELREAHVPQDISGDSQPPRNTPLIEQIKSAPKRIFQRR